MLASGNKTRPDGGRNLDDRARLIREELARRSADKVTREYRLVDEHGASLGVYGAVDAFRVGRTLTLPERGRWKVIRIEETAEPALYVEGVQTVAVVAPALGA